MEAWNIVKSELVDKTWQRTKEQFKKSDVDFIINTFLSTLVDEIKNGNNIKIEGFGTFSSYVRHAYIGKNVNGIIDEIPDTRYISFKPSKRLKNHWLQLLF